MVTAAPRPVVVVVVGDARNQLVYRNTGAACSSSANNETYTYDDAGNRLTAGTRTFSYDGVGLLTGCSSGCGTLAYDSAGRTETLSGWTFGYDAEGRLTSATSTVGTVAYTYDAEGHRTKLVVTPAGGSASTTEFCYQGDAIVEEKLTDAIHAGVVVRSYLVDEAGSIVKLTIPTGEPGAGSYLVTWNGHGDALALWRIDTGGALTLANSFTYDSWGTPTTATHNGVPDLGFRFLYVGRADVQWDNSLGLAPALHACPPLLREHWEVPAA